MAYKIDAIKKEKKTEKRGEWIFLEIFSHLRYVFIKTIEIEKKKSTVILASSFGCWVANTCTHTHIYRWFTPEMVVHSTETIIKHVIFDLW